MAFILFGFIGLAIYLKKPDSGPEAQLEDKEAKILVLEKELSERNTTITNLNKQLEIAALKEGVAINPGEEWTVDGTKNRCRMRLCFGNPDETLIREGIARLAVVCHQEFGVPSQISNIEQF